MYINIINCMQEFVTTFWPLCQPEVGEKYSLREAAGVSKTPY